MRMCVCVCVYVCTRICDPVRVCSHVCIPWSCMSVHTHIYRRFLLLSWRMNGTENNYHIIRHMQGPSRNPFTRSRLRISAGSPIQSGRQGERSRSLCVCERESWCWWWWLWWRAGYLMNIYVCYSLRPVCMRFMYDTVVFIIWRITCCVPHGVRVCTFACPYPSVLCSCTHVAIFVCLYICACACERYVCADRSVSVNLQAVSLGAKASAMVIKFTSKIWFSNFTNVNASHKSFASRSSIVQCNVNTLLCVMIILTLCYK